MSNDKHLQITSDATRQTRCHVRDLLHPEDEDRMHEVLEKGVSRAIAQSHDYATGESERDVLRRSMRGGSKNGIDMREVARPSERISSLVR